MQVLNFPSPYRQGEAPYDIFKDRMAAITQIVQGIKGRILNKYTKGLLDTTIDQINKSLTQDQATETINLLNADPGEDIYPDEEKLNTMAGQFVDTFNVMGKLAQKESTMGGMRSMQGIPPTQGMPPTSEVMLPKGDKAQLLNAIMSMPEGQMDFAPILNYMKENRPKMMGSFSPMEEWALNQAMGQIGDQKEELGKGLDLAKKYSEFFKEPQKARITNEIEFAREDPEGYRNFLQQKETLDITTKEKDTQMYIGMYNREEISRDELMKLLGGYVAEEKLSDFEKKWNMFIKVYEDNNMEIPLDNALKILGAYVGEEGTGGLKAPTYTTAENIEKGFMEKVETVQDFGSELKRLQGLGIDTKTFETTEYFAGLMEKKYEEALSVIQYCTQGIQSGEEADKDGLNYRDTYKEWWEKANNYDQQYFNITSKRLLTGE